MADIVHSYVVVDGKRYALTSRSDGGLKADPDLPSDALVVSAGIVFDWGGEDLQLSSIHSALYAQVNRGGGIPIQNLCWLCFSNGREVLVKLVGWKPNQIVVFYPEDIYRFQEGT